MLCILFQEILSWHLWNNLVRSGLSLCEAFSLPPRAIIETEANRHSAGADAVFFVLRRRLRKRAFDAPPYHKKIAQPKVARFFCAVPDRRKLAFRRDGAVQKRHLRSRMPICFNFDDGPRRKGCDASGGKSQQTQPQSSCTTDFVTVHLISTSNHN